MKLNLPNTIASSQDLLELISEIKEYGRWFAHDSIRKRINNNHASDAPVLSDSATDLLRVWADKKPIDRSSLDELIDMLKVCGDNATTITITLSAPATTSLKATLVAWCRKNISPNILVSFQFNSTLLGGMVVRYGSRIFDWSFRRKILAASQTFPEVLRHV